MLAKAKRPCTHPGCIQYAADNSSRCPQHKAAFSRRYDADRNDAVRKLYFTKRWRQERQAFLLQHPLCFTCHDQGILTPATVVDHIKPHKGDLTLFWDQRNWAANCKSCHDHKTAKEDGGFGNKGPVKNPYSPTALPRIR